MKIKVKGDSVTLETDYLGGVSDQVYIRNRYNLAFAHMRRCGIEEIEIRKNLMGYHESLKQTLIEEAEKRGYSKSGVTLALV